MSAPLIGFAELAEDGTIQLFVRAETDDGLTGHGLLFVAPDDPDYAEIKAMLPGREPGKRVGIPES